MNRTPVQQHYQDIVNPDPLARYALPSRKYPYDEVPQHLQDRWVSFQAGDLLTVEGDTLRARWSLWQWLKQKLRRPQEVKGLPSDFGKYYLALEDEWVEIEAYRASKGLPPYGMD